MRHTYSLEPTPVAGMPAPGRGVLDPKAKKQYDRLAKILDDMNVLSHADVVTLEILAQSLVDYYDALEQYEITIHNYCPRCNRSWLPNKCTILH